MQRFVIDRMIFFGADALCNAVNNFIDHCHAERPHQGLDNQILAPVRKSVKTAGVIQCRERLGGLLRYYYHAAA